MTVQLPAELKELILQDIQRGPYQTLDEFVEHAVRLLHEQESWLASQRDDIAQKIEEGWKAAARNELADEKQVRANMRERKRAWIEQQPEA